MYTEGTHSQICLLISTLLFVHGNSRFSHCLACIFYCSEKVDGKNVILTICKLRDFVRFFIVIRFLKKSLDNLQSVFNLVPGQARQFAGPDHGPEWAVKRLSGVGVGSRWYY